jgi:hypothetical protein
MPRIFGASLGNLLREGTQAGAGFLAGKQQREEREREQAIQAEQEQRKAMLEMALLEQRQAGTDASRALADQRRTPDADPLSQSETEGAVLPFLTKPEEGISEEEITSNVTGRFPRANAQMVRATIENLRRRREADARAAAGEARAAGRADAPDEESAAAQRRSATSVAEAYKDQAKSLAADRPEVVQILQLAALEGIADSFPGISRAEATALVADVFRSDEELAFLISGN